MLALALHLGALTLVAGSSASAQVPAPTAAPALPTYATLGREGLVLHDGDAPRRLAEARDVETFCFDRDARALVVTRGRELARVTLDGARVRLLEGPGEVRFPDVSPRDGSIAFALRSGPQDEQRWSVAVIDARGGALRVLAPGYDPCFTPDGRRIVYEDYDDEGADLWILDVDDPDAVPARLAPPRARGRYTPVVSPDGARVVFSCAGQLCSVGLSDGVERTLTDEGAYDRFASFAPDGATVLFYRQQDGRDLLVLRHADGAEDHSLGGGVRLAQFAPRRRTPNVIIVYADDMGFGDLGAQNPESKIPTPNMDRLAREGTRFTDAHSSSGICSPSRFALLTGTHHWRRFHGIVAPFGPSVFAPEDLTLAEVLRERGYDTACIGKWHLGWNWDALRREGATPAQGSGFAPSDFDWSRPIPDGPLAHGFDHYFGDDVPNFPPYTWIRDDRVVEPPTVSLSVSPQPTEGSAESRPGPMAEGWRQDMVMPRLTARVIAWLSEPARRERPFFLYWPWTSPHAPITPIGEFRGTTEAGGYGDYLHQSDHDLGQVLAALDELGFADDTLVIFTADNGPEHYAYARVRDRGHRSTGPLRGLKRDLFEGGHHVPFVVRWPGHVPAGRVSDALLGQVDIVRTLAALVGAELPDGAARDSIDQLAVWKGEADAARTFHVHNTFADRWAIRSGRWVLIDAPDGTHTKVPDWFRELDGLPREDAPALLYDLSRDPGERANQYVDHPDVVAELRALLARERGR